MILLQPSFWGKLVLEWEEYKLLSAIQTVMKMEKFVWEVIIH